MSLIISNCHLTIGSKRILAIDELAFMDQTCTALIGPNGAGKSTLLRALLSHPHTIWHGVPLLKLIKTGKVAWVGQHEQFAVPLSVRDYCLMGFYPNLAWYAKPTPADLAKVDELLYQFDLAHLAHKRIDVLSGGEQQRAAIIRAILQDAQILLLDEPTNHLDLRYQHQILHYIMGLSSLTVIMVLHDLNLALDYTKHAVLIDQGQVVAQDDTAKVLNSQLLSQVYNWEINVHNTPDRNWIMPKKIG